MGESLWAPSAARIKNTNMFRFIGYVNNRYHKNIKDYDELYEWSINNIPAFWESLWDFMDIIHSKTYEEVLVDGDKMPGARWFVGAQLNFAENLLRYRDDQLAIIFKGETGNPVRITYAQLYDKVACLARSMRL